MVSGVSNGVNVSDSVRNAYATKYAELPGKNLSEKISNKIIGGNLQADTVEFSTKTENKEVNNTETKPKASTAKKVGVGVASALLPGLGQVINGKPLKGAGLFLAAAIAAPISPLLTLGIGVYSVVDAVKNA